MLTLQHENKTFNVSAIILKSFDLNEADRVFTLLTHEYGLLKAIAKGIRRPKSKFSGHMEMLRSNQLQLFKGKTFHKLVQCESEYVYPELLNDYDRMLFGLLICEMLTFLCQEEDPQPELFQLTLKTFALLSQLEYPKLGLIWFKLQMLQIIGYEQNFTECNSCHQSLQNQRSIFFNLINGGLICFDCKSQLQSQFIRKESIEFLQKIQKTQPINLSDLKCFESELDYLYKLYMVYIQNLVDRELKTIKVINHHLDLQQLVYSGS